MMIMMMMMMVKTTCLLRLRVYIYFSSSTYSCRYTGGSFSCNKIVWLVTLTQSLQASWAGTPLDPCWHWVYWCCCVEMLSEKRNGSILEFCDRYGHSQLSKVAWVVSAGETLGPVCHAWRNCSTICRLFCFVWLFFLVFRCFFLSSLFFGFSFFLSFYFSHLSPPLPVIRHDSYNNVTFLFPFIHLIENIWQCEIPPYFALLHCREQSFCTSNISQLTLSLFLLRITRIA